jgi:hypothetical protein
MPIYYFKVKHSGKSFVDDEGLSFNNMDEAWEEATVAAGQLIKDLDGELVAGTICSIEVQDEAHRPIRKLNIIIEAPDGQNTTAEAPKGPAPQ